MPDIRIGEMETMVETVDEDALEEVFARLFEKHMRRHEDERRQRSYREADRTLDSIVEQQRARRPW